MFKRKRNDSDDDDTFARQILPVANLPQDFHGTPVDGAQYLFTVRRDAHYLPFTTRVVNPYETEEALPTPSIVKPSHPALPSEEWRKSFARHYKNFRQNAVQPVFDVQFTTQNENGSRLMPDIQKRDHWWAFIAGKPESEWNPPTKPKQISAWQRRQKYGTGMRGFSDDDDRDSDTLDEPAPLEETWHINDEGDVELVARVYPEESLSQFSGTLAQDAPENDQTDSSHQLTPPATYDLVAREPTPSLMKHMNHELSLRLLKYFTHWINVRMERRGPPSSDLTETHARWIFALISRVEDVISADDMNLLRNLARAAIALLKQLIQKRTASKGEPTTSGGGRTISEVLMSERSCWMIVSAVVGVWGQRDLWVDAEAMLTSLES